MDVYVNGEIPLSGNMDINLLFMNETNFTEADLSNYTTIHNESHMHYVSPFFLSKIKFVFGVILVALFSIFGSIGNIISLVVLFQQEMRNSTNFCLAALAISDTILLLHSLLLAAINLYIYVDEREGKYIQRIFYPALGAYGSVVSARITSWLTTMLSVERFIAVYRPIKVKNICSKRFTCFGILIIYVLTIILFLPLALKYKTKYFQVGNQTMNKIVKTAFGKRDNFFYVYGTILNVLFRFLPILVLVILNILIIHAIKRTWTIRRILSKNGRHSSQNEQNKITVMLLTVSFVFLICTLPGAISSIVSHIWPDYSRTGDPRKGKTLYLCVSYITFFLETVNSSVNFLIYTALSHQFCLTYKQVFCCKKVQINRTNSSYYQRGNINLRSIRWSKASMVSDESKFTSTTDKNNSDTSNKERSNGHTQRPNIKVCFKHHRTSPKMEYG